MGKYLLAFITSVLLFSSQPSQAFEQKVIKGNGLVFWTETFGNQSDPALLLVGGSGAQGLLWPQDFCEQLASKGYFVIRYDHRDTGLSSSIDYKKSPYTILDMAEDAVAILDSYKIEKAHVVGASMGGLIVTLMAAHYPKRLNSLTLLMTSPDFRPLFEALHKKPSKYSLSPPTPDYVDSVSKYLQNPPKTLDSRVKRWTDLQRIFNGNQAPFDEGVYQQIALQSFIRKRNEEGLNNHIKASQASFDMHQKALKNIITPTLIIHGDQDPIFPVDHAYALAKIIPNSKLKVIQSMGHTMNSHFYDVLVEEIAALKNN